MATTAVTLSEKLDELREYGEGLGLSESEINECFLEILGDRKPVNVKQKKEKKHRGIVWRACRVLCCCVLVFLAVFAAVAVTASLNDHFALFMFRNVITPIAYPVLTTTRSVGLFFRRTLEKDFIDYYDTDCLIDNPFYKVAIDPNDCSFCTEIREVSLLSNITRKEFKENIANTGSLMIVKDSEDIQASLPELQKLCLKDMHKIRAGANQFFFPGGSTLKGLDGFFKDLTEEQVLADDNFHALWYGRRVGPGQMLRKYFPRPYFVKVKLEMSLERKVFVDHSAAPSYQIVPLSLHNMWYVQSSGQRTLVFTPQGNCMEDCQINRVTVSEGDLVYWDDMYWEASSEPAPSPPDGAHVVSVSLLGAFA